MSCGSCSNCHRGMTDFERECQSIFRKYASSTDEDMIPSVVRYDEDSKKGIFYFKCDHRVDFRDLVKKLNSELNIAVEMRQIGERDEAALVGGIGPCGLELCCCRLGRDCCIKKNSTIKMAKNQGLSLNPSSISGMCGRLMCCLRYENEYYSEINKKCPKVNSHVVTPDGDAKVVSIDYLGERVCLKVDDEKPIYIPIDSFEPANDGEKPKIVRADKWDEYKKDAWDLQVSATNVNIDTSLFTGDDHMKTQGKAKLANKSLASIDSDVKHKNSHKKRTRRSTATTAKRPGGNSSVSFASEELQTIKRKPKNDRKPRKRRSTTITGD